MSKKIDYTDIIGKKFGRLTVTSLNRYENYLYFYNCKCDCGNECVVVKSALVNGGTKSCGCLKKENAQKMGKNCKKYEGQVCKYCGNPTIYAKGLCKNCYARMQHRGSYEYIYNKNNKDIAKNEKTKQKRLAYFHPTTDLGKEILHKMVNGATQKDIMKEYYISKQTIYNILKR